MQLIKLAKAAVLTVLIFTLSATPVWSQTSQNSFKGTPVLYSQSQSDRDLAEAFYNRGVDYYEQQKWDLALADFNGPRRNAVRSAKQYLRIMGFSRDGLIQQLSSDAGNGYEVDDATFAVDSLNVNWNEEAVRSAKQYLRIMGFSCDGLIQQLSSDFGDKYTLSQATFGAQQAGACN